MKALEKMSSSAPDFAATEHKQSSQMVGVQHSHKVKVLLGYERECEDYIASSGENSPNIHAP